MDWNLNQANQSTSGVQGSALTPAPPPTIPLCSKYEPAEVWGIVDELDECSSMNSIMESDAVPEVIQIRFL